MSTLVAITPPYLCSPLPVPIAQNCPLPRPTALIHKKSDCPLLPNLNACFCGWSGSLFKFTPPSSEMPASLLSMLPAPFLVRHHPEIVSSLNVLTTLLQPHLSYSNYCFLFSVCATKPTPYPLKYEDFKNPLPVNKSVSYHHVLNFAPHAHYYYVNKPTVAWFPGAIQTVYDMYYVYIFHEIKKIKK
jgi:hypothetical protein